MAPKYTRVVDAPELGKRLPVRITVPVYEAFKAEAAQRKVSITLLIDTVLKAVAKSFTPATPDPEE